MTQPTPRFSSVAARIEAGDMPADVAPVLLGIKKRQLQAFTQEHGREKLQYEYEIVDDAVRWLSRSTLFPLYEAGRFAASVMAVTWFRHIAMPDPAVFEDGMEEAPIDATGVEVGDFRLVWAEHESGSTRVRLAVPQDRKTIREGLGFRVVSQYGYVTLVWSEVSFGGNPEPVLTLLANRNRINQVIEHVLPDLGVATADAEYLDLREKVAQLRLALQGNVSFSHTAPIGEAPGIAITKQWAVAGMSLDEIEGSALSTGQDLAISREISCTLGGEAFSLGVSRVAPTTVFRPFKLDLSEKVLAEVLDVGDWKAYDTLGPLHDPGVHP